MEARWVTAFIDRDGASYERAERFWLEVTGAGLSDRRGESGEFATLVPAQGDPCLRVQHVGAGSNGSHLDLHVADVDAAVREATALGAQRADDRSPVAVMRSPGGVIFCLVRHHGEETFPTGRQVDGVGFVVDQICLDVPPDCWVEERHFWEQLTGWPLARSATHPELGWLMPPGWDRRRQFRILLQRQVNGNRAAGCHLDIAADDPSVISSYLESLGAMAKRRMDRWVVMEDPAGVEFCVTARPAATGLSAGRPAWASDDDLASAWARFAAVLSDYAPPEAYTVARSDPHGEVTFGHLNAPGGTHLLPAVVLSVVCEHATGTASYHIERHQLQEAIRLLTPAEAAAHVDHPNLWSWRQLLDDATHDSSFTIVFVHDLDDPATSPTDAEFRRRLIQLDTP